MVVTIPGARWRFWQNSTQSCGCYRTGPWTWSQLARAGQKGLIAARRYPLAVRKELFQNGYFGGDQQRLI
jgi:hypothetical protein